MSGSAELLAIRFELGRELHNLCLGRWCSKQEVELCLHRSFLAPGPEALQGDSHFQSGTRHFKTVSAPPSENMADGVTTILDKASATMLALLNVGGVLGDAG